MSVAIDGRDALLKLLLENSVALVGGIATTVVAAAGDIDSNEMALTPFFQKWSSIPW